MNFYKDETFSKFDVFLGLATKEKKKEKIVNAESISHYPPISMIQHKKIIKQRDQSLKSILAKLFKIKSG